MSLEIVGKVISVMPVRTGQGSKGPWHSQEFVLETGDKYPKKVCMTVWGEEAINKYDLVPGMTVTAHIELDSREYNGKWYTNVKAWKIEWKEQRRPDFPKKEEPAKEQTWPQPEAKSTVWPESNAGGATDDQDLPF